MDTATQSGTVTREEGGLITIVGNITHANRLELKERIMDALLAGDDVVIDLGRAGYLDTSALQILVSCAKYAAPKGAHLKFRNAPTEVAEYLALVGGSVFVTETQL